MPNCTRHQGGQNRAALDPVLQDLPESQAGEGRHKCAYCAYEAGYAKGYRDAQQRTPTQQESEG